MTYFASFASFAGRTASREARTAEREQPEQLSLDDEEKLNDGRSWEQWFEELPEAPFEDQAA